MEKKENIISDFHGNKKKLIYQPYDYHPILNKNPWNDFLEVSYKKYDGCFN